MKKKTLSKKEIKELNASLASIGYTFDPKETIEIVEEEVKRICTDGKPYFFLVENRWVPNLKLLLGGKIQLKKIIIDMGAVRFVCNGADIMRPGIREIDEQIEVGTIVQIIDETHKKPLAIGSALLGTEEMRKQTSGKSVHNLHFVGDKLWNLG